MADSFVATISGEHRLDNVKVRVVIADDLTVRLEDRPGNLLDTLQLIDRPRWHPRGRVLVVEDGPLMAIWCPTCNGDRTPEDF